MNSYGRAGMRPSCTTRSIGVYSCGAKPCRECDPLTHITTERSREKERWHLSQPITLLYGCSLLAAIRVAIATLIAAKREHNLMFVFSL